MKKLRIGVAGLGRAFTLMAPTFAADARVELVAVADPRPEARLDFQGKSYSSVEELCKDPAVEVVYVATPHQFHAEQARLAASHGKHLLVEKPMALTLEDCRSMINAAREARVALVVGHSHSFDRPILQARKIIEQGLVGKVRMITAFNFTDFLYRPRRPRSSRPSSAVAWCSTRPRTTSTCCGCWGAAKYRACAPPRVRGIAPAPRRARIARFSPSRTAPSRRWSTADMPISTRTSSAAGSASRDRGRTPRNTASRDSSCAAPGTSLR